MAQDENQATQYDYCRRHSEAETDTREEWRARRKGCQVIMLNRHSNITRGAFPPCLEQLIYNAGAKSLPCRSRNHLKVPARSEPHIKSWRARGCGLRFLAREFTRVERRNFPAAASKATRPKTRFFREQYCKEGLCSAIRTC